MFSQETESIGENKEMDEKYKRYLKEKMYGKKIAIWGTGKKSSLAEKLLQEMQVNEWEYIDIDKEKQKNGHNGKKVLSPDEIYKGGGTYVLIALLHSDEVADKLRAKGFAEIEDFMCVLKIELYFYLLLNYAEKCADVLKELNIKRFGEEGYGFAVCCDKYDENKNITVYSFGIGEDLSFSQELSDRFEHCEIYAFDPTPKAIRYVEKYDKSRLKKFQFFNYGLSNKSGNIRFYLPKNPKYVSGSEYRISSVNEDESIQVEMRTLKQLMNMSGHNHVDLLKMDIEGSEFDVIPQFLCEGILPEQICVELHDRLMQDGQKKRKELLRLMYEYGYKLIFMSESGEELTFVI